MSPTTAAISPKLTIEQVIEAPVDTVWALWTTRAGIEAWWGPEGFSVSVRSLDLRAGGQLHYVMTATGPSQVEFMTRAGMPLATETTIIFTEVNPPRRLAYLTLADFVPGVAPYDVATQIDLLPDPAGSRLVLAIDRMHDQTWTGRAVAGWESQLRKLVVLVG